MKLATWNVNSLRVRLPQVLDWLKIHSPDLLAVQETKVEDPAFPKTELAEAGYQSVFCGQKTYNGVAFVSRAPLADFCFELDPADPQRRFLGATFNGVRVINIYVPNGSEVGSEKYAYKLRWLECLERHLVTIRARYDRVLVLGDFNIAPEDRDVHDPEAWSGSVLVSEPERMAFRRLLQAGFVDLFRAVSRDEGCFSWWDYRLGAFRRNHGLRIDHLLASHDLAIQCVGCYIDRAPRAAERPSDHAPVVAEFADD